MYTCYGERTCKHATNMQTSTYYSFTKVKALTWNQYCCLMWCVMHLLECSVWPWLLLKTHLQWVWTDHFHKTRSACKTFRNNIRFFFLFKKALLSRVAWVVTCAHRPPCPPTWPSVPCWAQRRWKDSHDVSWTWHCASPSAAGTCRHKQECGAFKKGKKTWEWLRTDWTIRLDHFLLFDRQNFVFHAHCFNSILK